MKNLTKLLARFTLFSAAACAILFGLPALAEHNPFIRCKDTLEKILWTGSKCYE